MTNLDLAGVAAGILVAAAAVYAAVFSHLGYRTAKESAEASDARRRRDVEPRVSLRAIFGPRNASEVTVRASNAGGAVKAGYIIVAAYESVYTGDFTLQEHVTGVTMTVQRAGGVPTPLPGGIPLAIGQDVDGKWWDLQLQVPLADGGPPQPFLGSEFAAWAAERTGLPLGSGEGGPT